MSILTAIILLPLLAALALILVPRGYRLAFRGAALGVTMIVMILAVILFLRFDTGEAGFQFTHLIPWVESLGINYHVGVDGINIGLILMGAVVAFAAVCVAREIKTREKEFYILLFTLGETIKCFHNYGSWQC